MKNIKVRVISKDKQQENKAHDTLNFIVESNGGMSRKQIEALQELIEGGYIEALDNFTLIVHN